MSTPGYLKSETACSLSPATTNVKTILPNATNKATISKHISDFDASPMDIIEFEYLFWAVCDVAPKRDKVSLQTPLKNKKWETLLKGLSIMFV